MNQSGQKYFKEIPLNHENKVDVYAVIIAFDVKCPARQHAIKKLLCAGQRFKNDEINDLKEARDALDRGIELLEKMGDGK